MTRRRICVEVLCSWTVVLMAVGLVCTAPIDLWGSRCVGVAHAQGTSSSAKAMAKFQEGSKAYAEEKYDEAITLFKEAYTLRPGARLLLYIALSYSYKGDLGNALDYLVQYSGTSAKAAEEVREQITATRAELRKDLVVTAASHVAEAVDIADPSVGASQVTRPVKVKSRGPVFVDVPFGVQTNPAGARVYVDSKEWGSIGETPVTLRLFPGQHTIIVEKDYHSPKEASVVVKPVSVNSKPQNIQFELTRDNVMVSVRTEPPTARIVYINGAGDRRELGLGSFKGSLPAGPAKFVLTIEGETSRTVEEVLTTSMVDETGAVRLRYDMRDGAGFKSSDRFKMSELIINSYLQGAEVQVDGKPVGMTPGPIALEVAPGLHRVSVSQAGFKTWTTQISIKPGEEGSVETPNVLEV
ncbi:MAG: PEGA domain-containing protein, partial [Myxococcota bacterium]